MIRLMLALIFFLVCAKVDAKIREDYLLHGAVGYIIGDVTVRGDQPFLPRMLKSLLWATIIGGLKELADKEPDWKDLAFTQAGAIVWAVRFEFGSRKRRRG